MVDKKESGGRDYVDLEKLFFPDSIVIFGISDSPTNLGKEIIENLNRFAFQGRVYGIGRTNKEVAGRQVYAHPDQLPGTPDLAVLLVPAATVADALEQCGRKGMRHVVIETGGFSELGEERKGLEDEICRIARHWNITFMGPNCIGITNSENGVCLPFVPFGTEEVVKGRNSFISQSGGLIHEVCRRCMLENVGLSKLASIGNKLMIDENDVTEFLIHDSGTDVIGIYLESISHGRGLMDLAGTTSKPVVVLKGNTNAGSRQIASFHTAALLGDDEVASAAFRQAGIHRVRSMQEMVECFKIFSLPPLKGPNLLVGSRSGGQSVLLADECYRHGFSLPALPGHFFERIKEKAKAGVIRSTNPIDLGDVFDDLFYLDIMEMALEESGIDGVVFFYDYPLDSPVALDMIKGAEGLCRTHQKPVVFCMVPYRDSLIGLKYSSAFPFFCRPEQAFAGLQRSFQHFQRISTREQKAPRSYTTKEASVTYSVPSRVASAEETLSLFKRYEVPVVEHQLVRRSSEGIEAAHRIGYPVVLKIAEPFILHKTEAKAVHLEIQNDDQLKQAFEEMTADVYLLQKMALDGVDTIVGGKRDDEFGPVVMFGLGGIFVEVMKDVTMRVAPIDDRLAREMIEEIQGSPLLKGARGRPLADVEELSRVLVNVSKLLVDQPAIKGLDINPLRVFERGAGCLALDVKIERDYA
jgi:acetate---CoA ligase (ADP-forming)